MPGTDPGLQTIGPNEILHCKPGYPIPDGADAVVSHLEFDRTHRHFSARPVQPFEGVRKKGADLKAGTLLLKAGTRLTAASLALLAQSGIGTVEVNRRPRIAVGAYRHLSRAAGMCMSDRSKEYDGLSPLISASIESWGYPKPELVEIDGRDGDAVRLAALAALGDHDILILAGGSAVDAVGHTVESNRINQWPGSRLRLGRGGYRQPMKTWNEPTFDGSGRQTGIRQFNRHFFGVYFCMSGERLDVLVNLNVHLRGLLACMEGATDCLPRWRAGRLTETVIPKASYELLLPATVEHGEDGYALVRIADLHGTLAVDPDAILRIPAAPESMPAGTAIRYLDLR